MVKIVIVDYIALIDVYQFTIIIVLSYNCINLLVKCRLCIYILTNHISTVYIHDIALEFIVVYLT